MMGSTKEIYGFKVLRELKLFLLSLRTRQRRVKQSIFSIISIRLYAKAHLQLRRPSAGGLLAMTKLILFFWPSRFRIAVKN